MSSTQYGLKTSSIHKEAELSIGVNPGKAVKALIPNPQ